MCNSTWKVIFTRVIFCRTSVGVGVGRVVFSDREIVLDVSGELKESLEVIQLSGGRVLGDINNVEESVFLQGDLG